MLFHLLLSGAEMLPLWPISGHPFAIYRSAHKATDNGGIGIHQPAQDGTSALGCVKMDAPVHVWVELSTVLAQVALLGCG